MTSMTFDHSTISNLMSLIDEHKDDFTEGEYLQFCNMVKYLHIQQQPTRPVDFFTNATAASLIQQIIEEKEQRLRSNGCVCTRDKLKVLSEIYVAHSRPIPRQLRPVDILNIMQKKVIKKGWMSLDTLKIMYKDAKNERLELSRCHVRNEILRCEADLAPSFFLVSQASLVQH